MERECQRGVNQKGGCLVTGGEPSTVFYNVEDVEKVCLEGVSKGC